MPNSGKGPGGGGQPGEDLFVRLSRGAVHCGIWVLTFLYEGLQALGAPWTPQPPPEPAGDESPRKMLDAPPEGHPERLCRQTPMSPAEIDIWAGFYTDP
ncbi:DUF6059 family protein [Streptomyces sp. TBY4]|uniref:DUF6059 family protein n=1 Tax=Streptomyces sp. TBY4 TaxID=2962030 RepID=UPI0020B8BE9E|nr:DUF6059 family protein [Streptomyces sp. TBY4]MCP3760666.1 hypothetical protein [Streptomyces sp. TBY4]